MKLLKEKEERDRRKKQKDKLLEQEKKEKMAKDLAQKRKEEEESMNKLEGRMLIMLKNLQNNNTPKEYSLAGLNLGPARCRILAQNIAFNNTLTALHLARKKVEQIGA
jgi:ADP-ribosylglycohydrolase